MKLYIEAIILLLLLGVIGFWMIWNRISFSRALKKYKPENDKGRKNSEDATRGGETDIGAGKPVVEATTVPVPASPDTSNNAGKDGSGIGKNSNFIRKLLRRCKKR